MYITKQREAEIKRGAFGCKVNEIKDEIFNANAVIASKEETRRKKAAKARELNSIVIEKINNYILEAINEKIETGNNKERFEYLRKQFLQGPICERYIDPCNVFETESEREMFIEFVKGLK